MQIKHRKIRCMLQVLQDGDMIETKSECVKLFRLRDRAEGLELVLVETEHYEITQSC